MLRLLPPVHDPRLLVGNGAFDDAAVVRLVDGLALVQTLDFFTPPVDDPYDFGRIAAANAISDVYAMGAEPLLALAVLAVPADLDHGVVAAILRGGADIAAQAGIVVAGGHTVVDPEPKYGLVVTGTVHPDRVWRNGGGRPGDALLLSKPLGTGIVVNALRKDAASPDVLAAAVGSMTTLNRAAADRLRPHAPHAVTDVTGYGLLGHLHELAEASGCAARIALGALPLLPGVLDLVRAGHAPGGSRRNRAAADAYAELDDRCDPDLALLAADAQTSGGLLAAVDPGVAVEGTWRVGELVDGPSGRILVAP